MVLLKSLRNIFFIDELRKKLFFTLGVLIVDRIGTYIPVIGVNLPLLTETMQQSSGIGGLLSYFDIFSGGALSRCTVFALGIGPYITASIMFQLLSMTMPSLEQLAKEGEYGRKIINQYTRYLALALSISYSIGFITYLETKGLVLTPGWSFRILFTLTLTAGSMLVMWMGDQISMYGVGNGSSMLIFAGIVSRIPTMIIEIVYMVQQGNMHLIAALMVLVVFVLLTSAIVYLEKAQRNINVEYARKIVGNKVYQGQGTHIPFKINSAGVMPVIFASTILRFPFIIATLLSSKFPWLNEKIMIFFASPFYYICDFLLIVIFSFFYTSLIMNSVELADNIRKGGGFLPGIRPGRKTAEYFDYILTRIGLIGALYLALLAILPGLLPRIFNLPLRGSEFASPGISLLIAVGVALEFANQIESYLIEHKYEGFLSGGRVKGRS